MAWVEIVTGTRLSELSSGVFAGSTGYRLGANRLEFAAFSVKSMRHDFRG
jgi:hypothetical protein